MFQFLKSYGKVKAQDTLNGIAAGIIKADISGATQAQLDVYYNNLKDITEHTVDAQTAYNKEQSEADEAVANYNKKIDVAHVLQGRLAETTDEATKASLTASLNTVLSEIESLAPDVEREKQEAVDAKELLDKWIETRDRLKAKLDSTQDAIRKAQADIARSNLDKERSRELLNANKASAGLSTSNNDMDVVLNTMNKVAAENKRETEVNKQLAATFEKKAPVVDANIQSALNAVEGKSDAPKSVADRLASLQKM